jgi:ribosomal protein S18 acetylase RimI-like enzyme
MENLTVREVTDSNSVPWELLLEADPSRQMVEEYVKNGKVYAAFLDDELVGEYVLTPVSESVLELKNIAVAELYRGKGLGKKLVLDAIERARSFGSKTLEVGTGNSSLDNLALYQKCGFRIVGIEKDFFTKNYPEEIVENGIKCVDMVRLAVEF